MAKTHGAKDQKRTAKQKAKRLAKRSALLQRTSKDPTVRLQNAEKWPIVEALVGAKLWDDGIGHLLIARRGPEGDLVYSVFLVDIYCLGVKNAFWRIGTTSEIDGVLEKIGEFETMRPVTPACFSKIIKGAVEFAQFFGFPPHPGYRHASRLLDGIDPSTCPTEFKFGRDGRPFYIQGPNESPAQVAAIIERVHGVAGHYVASLSSDDLVESSEFHREFDALESDELEVSDDECL